MRVMSDSALRRRLISDTGALAVGSVAAVLSWQHIVHVAREYGHQQDWAAYLYPVSVDGLMIVGVVKAADDRATGRAVRPWARVATWLGGIMSISAQVGSAYVFGAAAITIAVAPSVCLIVVTEVMARRGRVLPVVETTPAPAEMPVQPAVVAAEPRTAETVAQVHPVAPEGPQGPSEPFTAGQTPPTVSLTKRRASPRKRPVPAVTVDTLTIEPVDSVDTDRVGSLS